MKEIEKVLYLVIGFILGAILMFVAIDVSAGVFKVKVNRDLTELTWKDSIDKHDIISLIREYNKNEWYAEENK